MWSGLAPARSLAGRAGVGKREHNSAQPACHRCNFGSEVRKNRRMQVPARTRPSWRTVEIWQKRGVCGPARRSAVLPRTDAWRSIYRQPARLTTHKRSQGKASRPQRATKDSASALHNKDEGPTYPTARSLLGCALPRPCLSQAAAPLSSLAPPLKPFRRLATCRGRRRRGSGTRGTPRRRPGPSRPCLPCGARPATCSRRRTRGARRRGT